MAHKVVVIGDGAWGTALALLADERGASTAIWGKFPDYTKEMIARRENFKFLAGVKLPASIELVNGTHARLRDADLYIAAIPTQFIRATFDEIKSCLPAEPWICSVAKGIEEKRLKRPSEILAEALPGAKIAVLSGPSHAEEVARRLPASVAVASAVPGVAERVQEYLGGERMRIYTSDDPIGVELGGALKNVMALAAGICEGLGLGDNAKSALVARGVIEMSRLGSAMGAKKTTFFGLSGVGDLITTSYSDHGRNLYVGRQIGAGKSLQEVLGGMEKVAEGVWTTRAMLELGRRHGVPTPIAQEVGAVLFEGKPPLQAVKDLMSRTARSELPDFA